MNRIYIIIIIIIIIIIVVVVVVFVIDAEDGIRSLVARYRPKGTESWKVGSECDEDDVKDEGTIPNILRRTDLRHASEDNKRKVSS